MPAFRWVNTMLGNLKTAITGTFHSIRRPYVPRYLAEFQWRFNRRARLADMVDQLLFRSPNNYTGLTSSSTQNSKLRSTHICMSDGVLDRIGQISGAWEGQ